MKLKWLSLLSLCALMLPYTPVARAFAYMTISEAGEFIKNASSGSPVVWQTRSAAINLGFDSVFNESVISAMKQWNDVGSSFIWQAGYLAQNPCRQFDSVSSAGWRKLQCDGTSFGDALAITRRSFIKVNNSQYLTEADIIVDQSQNWAPAYTGPLLNDFSTGEIRYDFNRVMVHELGHALGLDHPDDAGQRVTAIMNSTTSDIYTLQLDDMMGINKLYPPAGNISTDSSALNDGGGSDNGGGGGLSAIWLLLLLRTYHRAMPCPIRQQSSVP